VQGPFPGNGTNKKGAKLNKIAINDETRSNFHLFWDNFPFPVMLLHKDRTILELNAAAEKVGYPAGARCCDLGQKEDHTGCLANFALNEQMAKRVVGYVDASAAVLDSYWIPLAGVADVYVHFGIDITEYAAERLLPTKAAAGHACGSCNCK
jgi:hypothetical protein